MDENVSKQIKARMAEVARMAGMETEPDTDGRTRTEPDGLSVMVAPYVSEEGSVIRFDWMQGKDFGQVNLVKHNGKWTAKSIRPEGELTQARLGALLGAWVGEIEVKEE